MSPKSSHPPCPDGPLHLKRHLTECTDALDEIIRSSVGHPVSTVRSLVCDCMRSGVHTPGRKEDRREACRFFSVKLNDEEGMVHAHCRRCKRKLLVYDRALYWGVKRTTNVIPQVFPYMCSCGSHTFEMGIGLNYPEEALDENDIDMITIAVRCASCAEVALIFDDEAT